MKKKKKSVKKNNNNNVGAIFHYFFSTNVQNWDHFFSLFVPRDSEYLKSFDIGLWEVGVKRPLNRVIKWEKIQ